MYLAIREMFYSNQDREKNSIIREILKCVHQNMERLVCLSENFVAESVRGGSSVSLKLWLTI